MATVEERIQSILQGMKVIQEEFPGNWEDTTFRELIEVDQIVWNVAEQIREEFKNGS